jgi:hypothetical protein
MGADSYDPVKSKLMTRLDKGSVDMQKFASRPSITPETLVDSVINTQKISDWQEKKYPQKSFVKL